MRNPRIIIAQSSDRRFAQQNPRMVQIRTLRITYIYCKFGYLCKDIIYVNYPSGSKDTYVNKISQ